MHKALKKHAEDAHIEMQRTYWLDSLALERSNYFLEVLIASSKRKSTLYEKYLLIPRNKNEKLTHSERFGSPKYFKAPRKFEYPAIPADSCIHDLLFKSEIIGHVYEKRYFENRQDTVELISNILGEMHDETGLILPYVLLEHYYNTPREKAKLFAQKHNCVGISTLLLVREEKQGKYLWCYEFVVLNFLDIASR